MPLLDYPTHGFVVGYLASNALAKQDARPCKTVLKPTQRVPVPAPSRRHRLRHCGTSWRNFTCDRNFASPSWKAVIPLSIVSAATDNTCTLSEGLPDDDRLITPRTSHFTSRLLAATQCLDPYLSASALHDETQVSATTGTALQLRGGWLHVASAAIHAEERAPLSAAPPLPTVTHL